MLFSASTPAEAPWGPTLSSSITALPPEPDSFAHVIATQSVLAASMGGPDSMKHPCRNNLRLLEVFLVSEDIWRYSLAVSSNVAETMLAWNMSWGWVPPKCPSYHLMTWATCTRKSAGRGRIKTDYTTKTGKMAELKDGQKAGVQRQLFILFLFSTTWWICSEWALLHNSMILMKDSFFLLL